MTPTRRRVLGALTAASYARVLGANDRPSRLHRLRADWQRAFTGHPAGGPVRSDTKPVPWTEALKAPGSSQEQFDLHVRNFVDCVESRQRPIADVEGGHQVTSACHLANISLRTGRKIRWNPETEEIIGDTEASAYLERPYREPWDKVRRSLI